MNALTRTHRPIIVRNAPERYLRKQAENDAQLNEPTAAEGIYLIAGAIAAVVVVLGMVL